MMRYLQKLGKALFLPVAVLPVCGILMGLGYAMAPAALGVPGYATEGAVYVIGFFLIKAGAALIENMALLFAVGVAVGLSEEGDGTGALAGLVSWLMITRLLCPDVVEHVAPKLIASASNRVAFENIENPFIGILCGIIGAVCYNRFKNCKMPEVLGFFSGKRSVAIVTAVVSVVLGAVLLFAWPFVFTALVQLGKGVKNLGIAGVGMYAFLNRLLIPTGLHHALNNVFWFDTIGIGDMTAYWGGQVLGDIHSKTGNAIDWSVGSYMAGFFPCIMFGIPGAALAMIQTAKPEKRKATIGVVGSAALCAFLCGITEPFEFSFMFLAFPLYVVYALLYAVFASITVALGYRAGFCFSPGLTDAVFSSFLPAANRSWLLIPLGLAAFLVYYLVFFFAIKKWNLKTPGREDDQQGELRCEPGNSDYAQMARIILEGIGGRENIGSIDHCITRLRLEVKDRLLVDEKKIKSSGAAGVIRPGKNAVQVVIGPKVQFVYEEFRKLTK